MEHSNGAQCVDDMLQEAGETPSSGIPTIDFSLVDVFDRPDGHSPASPHLMGVIHSIGLVLIREGGMFKKRTKADLMYYSDTPPLEFVSSDREQGGGYGWFQVQALAHNRPLFTLGWPWSYRRSGPEKPQAERDRIPEVLVHDAPRGRGVR